MTGPRRSAIVGRLLCIAGAAAGVLGLVGWMTGATLLATIIPGQPPMVPNTALALLLIGLAGALMSRERVGGVRRALAVVAAIVVLGIGLATLAEYALDIDLSIDRLVLRSDAGPHHGRPSPPTAAALAFLAVAMLLFDFRPTARARPSEWLLLLAGLTAFTALLGQLFGAGPLYRLRPAPVIGVAVPTAVGLLLAAVGMLLERPAAGVMRLATSRGPGGLMLRRLGLAALLAPLVLGLVVTRSLAVLGVEDVPLAFAILTIVMTVVTLLLLAVTALPLNRTHEALESSNERTRQAQERFELALEGANLAAWDWNIETGEVVLNPRWAEMRGFRPEEVRPHVDTWIAGIHPEDRPHVEKVLGEHLQGLGPQYETEHRVSTKSGEWIWILDRGRVFARDASGKPTRMLGTELDVTARRKAEEALRLSEAKFSGIISVSADAIVSIDAAQRITTFNEGAEKIFGYSKAEAIGAPLDLLLPERFRALHRHYVERFAKGEDVARRMGERGAEILGLRKNGDEFPADAAISRLEVDGKMILTASLRDVTEQKRMEREQRFLADVGSVFVGTLEYEETLDNIARLAVRDLADVCIVAPLEEDGEVRRQRVVSRDPSKAGDAELLMQLPIIDRRRPPLWSVFETREPVVIERVTSGVIAAWAQGEKQLGALRRIDPKSVLAVPLLARGKLLGAVVLVSSTPSRLYGPADVRAARELAQRAALSLENARLYRTAQQATKLRDDVLGIVAHDLRNPLGTILLNTTFLLRRGAAPDGAVRRVEAIERAATRMNRLIQDLLDVTRMEAGRLSMEQSRLRTAQVVSDSVEAQNALASSAAIELRAEVAPDLPEVWADHDRLLQVFENLIGNALKFTKASGHIRVGATPREHEVVFWVTDTGAGIPAEDVPHLFDRFWQARTARHRGAGLGLPIVKGIVEAHGGRIWVESTEGRGTTFFFTIPRAPQETTSLHQPATHGP